MGPGASAAGHVAGPGEQAGSCMATLEAAACQLRSQVEAAVEARAAGVGAAGFVLAALGSGLLLS